MFSHNEKLCLVLLLSGLISGILSECLDEHNRKREHSVNEMPFLAAISFINNYEAQKNNPQYLAVGTIIATNLILTRAYFCEVAEAASFTVQVGVSYRVENNFQTVYSVVRYDIPEKRRREGAVTYDEVKSVTGYKFRPENDFCILLLNGHFNLSESVQVAALPVINETITGDIKQVSGWGDFQDSNTIQGMNILSTDGTYDYKIATLFNYYPRVMNWRDCNWIYTAINQVLAPSLQCLTGLCTDDRSTYGDDGGPVYCQGTMKVIGIVCNTLPLYGRELEFPQTFCPLAPYVEWIQMTRMKWEFIL